ncbi:hypothetical protein Q7P35_003423 [Cladosporium inversicolor]
MAMPIGGALGRLMERRFGLKELRKGHKRMHLSHGNRNHDGGDMRRLVQIAQSIMAQKHSTLHAISRSYRRRHALAVSDLPLKEDKDPDIAG